MSAYTISRLKRRTNINRRIAAAYLMTRKHNVDSQSTTEDLLSKARKVFRIGALSRDSMSLDQDAEDK